MIFYLAATHRMGFKEIPAELMEFFRYIPEACTPQTRSLAAENRLFPSPISDIHRESESSFTTDWIAYVQPDIYAHFQSSLATVEDDLRHMKETSDGYFQVEFPLDHGEAWIHTLNQVRLTLAANFRFTEEELAEESLPEIRDERSLALAKIHFYAFLQHCIVERLLNQI